MVGNNNDELTININASMTVFFREIDMFNVVLIMISPRIINIFILLSGNPWCKWPARITEIIEDIVICGVILPFPGSFRHEFDTVFWFMP